MSGHDIIRTLADDCAYLVGGPFAGRVLHVPGPLAYPPRPIDMPIPDEETCHGGRFGDQPVPLDAYPAVAQYEPTGEIAQLPERPDGSTYRFMRIYRFAGRR